MPTDYTPLIELTASALYMADALDHNQRDEAPWALWDAIADQSKVKYRKQAARLAELNLVILPVGRIVLMEKEIERLTALSKGVKAGALKKREAAVAHVD